MTEYSNVRIYKKTREDLGTAAELNGVPMIELLDKLVNKELKRTNKRIICVQHDGGRLEVDPDAK